MNLDRGPSPLRRCRGRIDRRCPTPSNSRLRLRYQRPHLAAVDRGAAGDFGDQLVACERHVDDAFRRSVHSMVDADVPRQHLGRDGHRRVGANRAALPLVAAAFADRLEHLGIGVQLHVSREAPGLRVRTRVGEGHLDLQVAEVRAPVSLCHTQRLGMRLAISAQPGLFVVSVTVDDQRVALPTAHRVPHPAWRGVRLQCAAIHVDDAIREVVVQNGDDGWCLEDALPPAAVSASGPLGRQLYKGRPLWYSRWR